MRDVPTQTTPTPVGAGSLPERALRLPSGTGAAQRCATPRRYYIAAPDDGQAVVRTVAVARPDRTVVATPTPAPVAKRETTEPDPATSPRSRGVRLPVPHVPKLVRAAVNRGERPAR